eukprot:CAMPEP_0172319954 /NCGR_PEP_ID=MMETSP1058-20130122/39153_1 /TAXON_ID=83371 /ORGANISM="Detonula confervacea, Strain CCMP 353" /LENGTH=377 /DNA_ID=CAMNT_0013035103 /DNA_START=146 /DNA_END=1276 /DNA_ORIENTATION=+
MDFDEDDESWDNGSWDNGNASVDVELQHRRDAFVKNKDADESESSDAIQPPPSSPNDRIEKRCVGAPGAQSPLIGDSGAIKTSELQCNCLELIMPLTENDTRDSRRKHGLFDLSKLPDGTATKTLPDGTSVLVNYERLLQNEATKRILLQRSAATYTDTITKLQSRLRVAEKKYGKAENKLDFKLAAAHREIAQLKDSMANHHTPQNYLQPPRQWLQQKAKSRGVCLTFKFLLIISILWLAVMNVSIHTIVVKKLFEQQLNERRQLKQSFLRQRDPITPLESEERQYNMQQNHPPTGKLSDSNEYTNNTNQNVDLEEATIDFLNATNHMSPQMNPVVTDSSANSMKGSKIIAKSSSIVNEIGNKSGKTSSHFQRPIK